MNDLGFNFGVLCEEKVGIAGDGVGVRWADGLAIGNITFLGLNLLGETAL